MISRSLLTFLLNSLWQVPLAAAVAALACRLMRNGPARHRHAIWVTALMTAILLPLSSLRTGEQKDGPRYDAATALAAPSHANPAPQQPAQTVEPSPGPAARTILFAQTTAVLLLGVYLLFTLFLLVRLTRASIRTVQIRRAAKGGAVTEALERVWCRCQQAFGLKDVEIRFSAQISGPVTARRTIILPESLLSRGQQDILTTAIGHEMAHIARRDFACNLLYELLLVPIGFHPAAWMIRRAIERTREMACDELVIERLIDANAYARSILSIATEMTARPSPGYTLGVFDGDILEERIRRLVERPAATLKHGRLFLASGLSALALCAFIGSGIALTARAQGGAQDLIRQAEAAYNRGDQREAVELLARAVNLEPRNVKAKLSLANALLHEYIPGTDPDGPLVAGARQQYLEILSHDPGNKEAIRSMMVLTTNAKQYGEAHDWAVKAIQADPNDKGAYYTAGFVDWVVTYPDYANARLAAGMKPQDSGILPDAGLRQGLRVKHMGHIEDGFRMLQIALQIDPEYADAMAYMNLLSRIAAGIAENQARHDELMAEGEGWVTRALAVVRKGKQQPPPPPSPPPDVNRPAWELRPPPPPPPPPPPEAGQDKIGTKIIRVEGSVQQAMLLKQTPPVYPAAARSGGITGVVQLGVLIARDGTVRHVEVTNGPAELVDPATAAVRQWLYRPTLRNGEAVEVATTVNLNFSLP